MIYYQDKTITIRTMNSSDPTVFTEGEIDLEKLPNRIANKVAGLKWDCDDMGESGSTILLFDEMVLKVEQISRSSINEKLLLEWLDGKLPVPKLIEAETQEGYSYLLMSKLPGEMACSSMSLRDIETTIIALAKGLKMLWKIDVADCPCTNTVNDKIIEARYNIDNDLVDIDDFNPETFTTEGFKDVEDLYSFLDKNRPAEDLVFTHGDYCLPNIFIDGGEVKGFIDIGSGGIADRWQDIALCARSLQFNCVEHAGYGDYNDITYKTMLFDELGIPPNEEKIRYFTLLDELF